MVNTHSNPATSEQGEASAARGENLPHPPSLAEVMLEAERNKHETNRLLERIEQNTARHQRNDLVLEICPRGNNKRIIIIFPCS